MLRDDRFSTFRQIHLEFTISRHLIREDIVRIHDNKCYDMFALLSYTMSYNTKPSTLDIYNEILLEE